MNFPEHKLAFSLQKKHTKATVCAGPEKYYAQAPQMLAVGRITSSLEEAQAAADAMQELFDNCPTHQLCVAAQAAMGV